MTKAQKIEEYIKDCFKTYCIDISEFFSVVTDNEEAQDMKDCSLLQRIKRMKDCII